MLLLHCPYCGARPEVEFRCGGEAHIIRPENPQACDDESWARFLYFRSNPRGAHAERWLHAHGCGRWFNALRDTASDTFGASYPMGHARPEGDA